MAVTYTQVVNNVISMGNCRCLDITFTGTGTYTTGGDTLTAASMGFDVVIMFLPNFDTALSGLGNWGIPAYVTSTGKLQLMTSGGSTATLTEMASSTSVSTMVFRAFVFGF